MVVLFLKITLLKQNKTKQKTTHTHKHTNSELPVFRIKVFVLLFLFYKLRILNLKILWCENAGSEYLCGGSYNTAEETEGGEFTAINWAFSHKVTGPIQSKQCGYFCPAFVKPWPHDSCIILRPFQDDKVYDHWFNINKVRPDNREYIGFLFDGNCRETAYTQTETHSYKHNKSKWVQWLMPAIPAHRANVKPHRHL